MTRDDYGRIEYNSLDIIDILYQNPDLDTTKLHLSENDLKTYNESCEKCSVVKKFSSLPKLTVTVEEYDKINQNNWFIPKEYFDINIVELLLDKTSNEEEYQRVVSELELYYEKDMIHILIIAIYLVENFRKNNIVWGVGRGSSVSSFCLYLIGLHKINSLKYNLDIREFLK
jgi:DNA polymerase III alpha subunit